MTRLNDPLFSLSEDLIEGLVYDNVAGVLQLVDLTGSSVKIRAYLPGAVIKEWVAVPDSDQVNNKGKFSYQLIRTPTPDIPMEGSIELQLLLTAAGKEHRSDIVEAYAVRAI